MSEHPPLNNLSWRVTVLEREVERIKEGKPDVVSERVRRLSDDVAAMRQDFTSDIRELRDNDLHGLREELATQRKILIGFFVSFALLALGVALSYILSGHPVG